MPQNLPTGSCLCRVDPYLFIVSTLLEGELHDLHLHPFTAMVWPKKEPTWRLAVFRLPPLSYWPRSVSDCWCSISEAATTNESRIHQHRAIRYGESKAHVSFGSQPPGASDLLLGESSRVLCGPLTAQNAFPAAHQRSTLQSFTLLRLAPIVSTRTPFALKFCSPVFSQSFLNHCEAEKHITHIFSKMA